VRLDGDPGRVWPPSRRPGLVRFVGRLEVWKKSDAKSDFRHRPARESGPGSPIVDEDAANVTLSGL
jgi:hypothetical protein